MTDAQPLPHSEAFAAIYDDLLELADAHIDRPRSATIDTWEDGTFRIRIYHQRHPDTRESLYYHSEEGVVRYGVEDLDAGTLTTEREITTL